MSSKAQFCVSSDVVRTAGEISPKGTSRFSLAKYIKSNKLSLFLVVGVFAGLTVGCTLQVMSVRLSPLQVAYLRFPGEIFLQMMQMVLIPVVVSSLLVATADIDVHISGKIGIRAMMYYIITLVLAALMGVLLSATIRPGSSARSTGNEATLEEKGGSPLYAFLDLIRNLIPENIVEACFLAKATSESKVLVPRNPAFDELPNGNLTQDTTTNMKANITSENWNGTDDGSETTLLVEKLSGVNMIGLASASVMVGSIISYLGGPAKPVYDLFLAVRIITFQLVSIFMWYAPVGIASLIASTFAGLPNLSETFHNLMIFTVVVIAGLLLHGFLVLPVIYLLIVRKNPFRFIKNLIPAMLLAFGSESSGVTLPVTIRCLEENNGIDSRITRLLSSIGATINMDGICLYFSMLTHFVAQLNGITLNAGQIVTSSLLAISVAIGVGCVPGAHLVYITMVPAAMHLPTHQVSMVLAVDWLLTRLRTVVNVIGDCFGAGIVESLSKKELKMLKYERTDHDEIYLGGTVEPQKLRRESSTNITG